MFGKFGKVLTSFYKRGHKVLFKKGVVKTPSGKNITSLEEGLNEIAKCSGCGCSDCYGYRTWTDVCSGTLMISFIENCEMKIMTECAGVPYLKEKKACRDAPGTEMVKEEEPEIIEEEEEPVEDEV